MTFFRSDRGRLRWGWRLGLFVLVFSAMLAAVGYLLRWLPIGVSVATGMMVGTLVFVAAAVAASWFMAEKVEGLPMAALGLPVDRLLPRELARGFLVGAGLIALAVGGMAAAGWVRWTAEPGGLAAGAFIGSLAKVSFFLALAAFMEELIFRGYPFQVTAEGLGVGWALALTSLLFAAAHAGNPGLGESVFRDPKPEQVLPLVNLGLAGLVLGLAYWRTYSLWFATGLHVGWNWTMGFAADLPVSGLEPGDRGFELFETPGFDAVVQGPELLTGGSFGPEGGLVVTAVSLAGIVWLARTDRLSRGLRVRALGPLPDRDGGPAGPGGDGGEAGPAHEPDTTTESGPGGPGSGTLEEREAL